MRVLSSVLDPRPSGPTKRSLGVARLLRPKGIETVFLLPEGDNEFAETAREDGFEVVRIRQPRIRAPKRIPENLRFLLEFRDSASRAASVIDRRDIDIVHANGPLNYQVALAAHRSDASLVWHFNDTLTPTPLKQLSQMAAQRWADTIVVAADAVHDYFFSRSVDSETVYAPVTLDEFEPTRFVDAGQDRRAEFGIGPESLVIGTVGNVNPTKGHEHLIDAAAKVAERNDVGEIDVVIVGRLLDSQERHYHELRERVKGHGLGDTVTFTGWRSDIPELLSMFDVFVLPSVTEACPIVVLEAMAMRRPVIATDVGGVREQIPGKEFGWVVPPEDSSALAGAITTALKSPELRRKKAQRARTRVEEVFSLERCAERHAEVYERTLESA